MIFSAHKPVTQGLRNQLTEKTRYTQAAILVGSAACFISSAFAGPTDTDGDGLGDAFEDIIGTDINDRDKDDSVPQYQGNAHQVTGSWLQVLHGI